MLALDPVAARLFLPFVLVIGLYVSWSDLRAMRIPNGSVVLLALVFVGPQTPLGWIGIVPLATGLLGWCPLYTLLGINTCPMKK